MTEDERYEITVLAEDYAAKKQLHDIYAIANQPADPVKARDSQIKYLMVRAEMIEAKNRLDAAMARLGTS